MNKNDNININEYPYNCKFIKKDKTDCKILKKLYCRCEDKKCVWYKRIVVE